MAKLVDAPDLGSGVLRRVGSSPIRRTMIKRGILKKREFLFFLRIDNASSKRSREAPRQWCRVGCEKRVLSILLSESTMRVAIGHAQHRASGAVWAAIRRRCQFQKCDEAIEGFIKIRERYISSTVGANWKNC